MPNIGEKIPNRIQSQEYSKDSATDDICAQEGSVWRNPNGNRNVAYLWSDGSYRNLNLNWFDNSWNQNYRFLAFRQCLYTSAHCGTLSDEEKTLIRSYFRTSFVSLIRHKAQAVNMRSNGLTTSEIAALLYTSERTIERWIKDFSKRRTASVFSGLTGNQNAAKLTPKPREEIKKVLKQPPNVFRPTALT